MTNLRWPWEGTSIDERLPGSLVSMGEGGGGGGGEVLYSPSSLMSKTYLSRTTSMGAEQLVGDPSINPIVFGLSPPTTFGVRRGTLNRVTGTASVHIIKDGLQVLNGICKPARKVL